MVSFEYVRPTTWFEAMELIARPGAVAKMGGCDVLTRHRSGKLDATLVVGLNILPDVCVIDHAAVGVRIGPGVTLKQFSEDERIARSFPVLANVAGTICTPALRSAATVIGNLAQGWTASDIVPLLLVHDAVLHVSGAQGDRSIPISNFCAGETPQALKAGELIVGLTLPTDASRCVAYERFALRNAADLPLVSVAVSASIEDGRLSNVRVASCGTEAKPSRADKVESILERSNLDETVDQACAALRNRGGSISDHNASGAYRTELLVVLFARAVRKLGKVQDKGGRDD